MAEVPLGLWIVFVGIMFPVFVLITMTIRFAIFWEATRQAADAACQCQTYQNDVSTTQFSAVDQALSTAQQVASVFPGVTVGTVQTYIVQTPISQGVPQAPQIYGPNTALGVPADTQQNMYQIRVIVTGQIQPMIPLSGGFLGVVPVVPGATQPLPVSVSEDRIFENPGGLNS